MSAILIVNKLGSWSVSNAVFDIVLELIAAELETHLPETAIEIRARINNLPYWSIESLDTNQFQAFEQATMRAFEYEFQTGKQRQSPLSMHLGAYGLNYFSELKAVLRIDSRSKFQGERTGKIRLRDDAVWEAPDWVYDLLLEIFAAFISESEGGQLVPKRLMEFRSIASGSECDLHSFSDEQMNLFIQPLDRLHLRYIVSGVSNGHAPEFATMLFPCLIKLYDLFQTDPRITRRTSNP